MKYFTALIITCSLCFCTSCLLITDAATRLALDLEDGAKKLMASDKEELEIKHEPLSMPDGVGDNYFIWFQAVDPDNNLSGTLSVGTVKGKRYGTSSHLHFVTVKNALRISKKNGQPTYIKLRKTGLTDKDKLRGDKPVEIISIR